MPEGVLPDRIGAGIYGVGSARFMPSTELRGLPKAGQPASKLLVQPMLGPNPMGRVASLLDMRETL